MVNSYNNTSLTIASDVYDELTKIKTIKNCTYDELIKELIELEFSNNYIQQVQYFEASFSEDIIRIFKITFKKENFEIEYYDHQKNTFSKKIESWKLNTSLSNAFIEFIKSDYARCFLENLPDAIAFSKFIINHSEIII